MIAVSLCLALSSTAYATESASGEQPLSERVIEAERPQTKSILGDFAKAAGKHIIGAIDIARGTYQIGKTVSEKQQKEQQQKKEQERQREINRLKEENKKLREQIDHRRN